MSYVQSSLSWQIPLGACETFFECNASPGYNLPIYVFEKISPTSAKREILHHLSAPSIVFQIIEPDGKRMTLVFAQSGDRLF